MLKHDELKNISVLPATLLAQRLPIGRYLGCTIVVWGIVTMLTVTVRGFHGFLAQRYFFLARIPYLDTDS